METKGRLRAMKITGVVIFNLICLFSIFYCITTTVEKKQAVSDEVRIIKEFEGPKESAKPPALPPAAQAALQPTAQTFAQAAAIQAASAQTTAAQPAIRPGEEVFVIDDFEGDETKNKIGSKTNIYVRAPSNAMITTWADVINGNNTKVLMIKYNKKNTGGPNGMGGWCGYYTLLKNEKTGKYFDGTGYGYITFWVKGQKGDESFMVGLADAHWDKVGDSLKSEEVGTYLPKGKITTEWQKAKMPLNIFFLDYATLSAITINFEAECFAEGAGSGVIFIDDITLEK